MEVLKVSKNIYERERKHFSKWLFASLVALALLCGWMIQRPIEDHFSSTKQLSAVAPARALGAPAALNVVEQVRSISSAQKEGLVSQWQISYGSEFWREKVQFVDGRPFDPQEVADRVSHAFSKMSPAPRVLARSFEAVLTPGGFRFHPLASQDGAAQAGWLEIGNTTIDAGGARVSQAPSPWTVEGNVAQRKLRDDGAIVEHIEARGEGVSTTWVLHQPLQGDAVISWSINGMAYVKHSERGAHYAGPDGVARVRVGNVTAVDSQGRRTDLPLFHSAEGVRIEIPEVLLAEASYPLAIDPTVSAEFDFEEPSDTTKYNVDAARLNDRWLVVWSDNRTHNAGGPTSIVGVRVDASGTVLDLSNPIGIRHTTTSTDFPTVASNGAIWMVGWIETSEVRAVSVSADRQLGTNFEAGSGNVTVDVAALGSQFLFVSQDAQWDADARVTSDSAGLASAAIPFGKYNRDIEVASDGSHWMIAWTGFTGDDMTPKVKTCMVDALGNRGTIQIPFQNPEVYDISKVAIAASQGRYLVLWDRAGEAIKGFVLDGSGGLLTDVLTVSESTSPQQDPVANATADGWLAIWSSGTNDLLGRGVLTTGAFEGAVFSAGSGQGQHVAEAIGDHSLLVYGDFATVREAHGRLVNPGKKSQTIAFRMPDMQFDAAPIRLEAKSSARLAISYKVSGPARLVGRSLVLTGLGRVKVTALQKGNSTYNAAESVTVSFTVRDLKEPKLKLLNAPRTTTEDEALIKGVITDNYKTEAVKFRITPPGGKPSRFKLLDTKSDLGGSRRFSIKVPTPEAGVYEVEIIPIDKQDISGRKETVKIIRK